MDELQPLFGNASIMQNAVFITSRFSMTFLHIHKPKTSYRLIQSTFTYDCPAAILNGQIGNISVCCRWHLFCFIRKCIISHVMQVEGMVFMIHFNCKWLPWFPKCKGIQHIVVMVRKYFSKYSRVTLKSNTKEQGEITFSCFLV